MLLNSPQPFRKPPLLRAYERWRVGRTQLGTLLRRRHVDIPTYIDYTPSAALKAQLAACTSCPQAERCCRALNSLGAATSNYAFCVNLKEIQPFFESAPLVTR